MDQDRTSVLPKVELSRRNFVVTSLAGGFALAVQPVSADTITTDTDGLTAGEVKIPVSDGEIPAYRAMPAKGGSFPTVLVVQEIFGVHEHIKDVCRRFAKLGYFAIAPEMYARQGDVSKLKTIPEIFPIVAKVPDKQVMADLDAAVAYAKCDRQGRHDQARHHRLLLGRADRLAVFGAQPQPQGRRGLVRRARQEPEADRPPADQSRSTWPPTSRPRSSASTAQADNGIPVADVEKMREALKAAGKPSRDHRLSRDPARLQRRLPADLPRRNRPRTAGSSSSPGSRRTAWPDHDRRPPLFRKKRGGRCPLWISSGGRLRPRGVGAARAGPGTVRGGRSRTLPRSGPSDPPALGASRACICANSRCGSIPLRRTERSGRRPGW